MNENFKLAKKAVEEFEKITNDFSNNMETLCKETWKVTLNRKYGFNYIELKNEYLKYTSNKKNYDIIDMRINKILKSEVDRLIDNINNNNYIRNVTIYNINEYRGEDERIDITYITNNEYKITYDKGTEGYGNTYYYLIKKNNLLEILNQIKKYSEELN